MSHKPDGRLPLLSTRPAVNLATLKRVAASFAVWWTEARWMWTVCLRLTWQRRGWDLNQGRLHPSPACWPLGYRANQYNVDNSDVCCAGFFVYKLVRSLRDKALAREEKKKLKQQRREKEMTKKTKKKWCTVHRHWTSHVTFLWSTCTIYIYWLTDWLEMSSAEFDCQWWSVRNVVVLLRRSIFIVESSFYFRWSEASTNYLTVYTSGSDRIVEDSPL